MKILFIFTGGTIGSTEKNGCISSDGDKPYILLREYSKRFGIDLEYDTYAPYTELSENNSGETIRKLICAVSESLNRGYDGIVVTHGTDTLQFSAAALAYTVKPSVPVMLVSANRPIEDPLSNGIENLHGAICFIRNVKRPGVWAVYKNSGQDTAVHYGSRLLRGSAFSDRFYSIKNSIFGYFDKEFNFRKEAGSKELPDEISPLVCGDLVSAAKRILIIEPYPGMVYPDIEGIDFIIHNSYHSGTINTKSYLPGDFFEKAKAQGTVIFLTGSSTESFYESTAAFEKIGVIPVPDISPVSAYVKLWLCVSSGTDPKEVMCRSLAADIVPQGDMLR